MGKMTTKPSLSRGCVTAIKIALGVEACPVSIMLDLGPSYPSPWVRQTAWNVFVLSSEKGTIPGWFCHTITRYRNGRSMKSEKASCSGTAQEQGFISGWCGPDTRRISNLLQWRLGIPVPPIHIYPNPECTSQNRAEATELRHEHQSRWISWPIIYRTASHYCCRPLPSSALNFTLYIFVLIILL